MEPARVPLKVNYVVYSVVKRMEFRRRMTRAWKDGDTIKSDHEDLGWFVTFTGSWEAMNFGMEEPRFKEGDRVKITFERQDQ